MEEAQFFTEGNALVTSTRVVLAGKTYATRNIGSVGLLVRKPGKVLPVLLLVVGGLALLGGAYGFGAGMVAVGGLWLLLAKPLYELRLMAGGGEVLALSSKDGGFMQRVHDAIASAIAVR